MSTVLKNKVIVITRDIEQAEGPIKKLESLGAKVISFPTIKVRPIETFNLFDTYASDLHNFDYIIFTSENAVKFSFQRLMESDISIPEKTKVICVGKKTEEVCKQLGIKVDFVPADYSAKGLLNLFADKNILEKKFFIPSSAIARVELKEGLIAQGAEVIQTPIYDVGLPEEEDILKNKKKLESVKPDLYIFTSPSTFNNLLEILEVQEPVVYFTGINVAAIGPTTLETIEETGIKVNITPKSYTMDDLIDSIIEFYSNN